MVPKFITQDQIPHKPGVYQFKNSQDTVIYVGKAIDLHSRVRSYFSGIHLPRTIAMVKEITALETIIVESELEALILEANLIKKCLPLYNIKLTDDKDYLYIGITKEDYPRIITARRSELKNLKAYFGPFPSSSTVRSTLKRLRKIFPWCQSPPKEMNLKLKPCFYYHLKLCPGACIGEISHDDYLKIIKRFSKFMDGKKDELISELTQEMNLLAKNLEFEKAQSLKKTLDGIGYLLQSNRSQIYLENPNFLSDQTSNALADLQRNLQLAVLPVRIECFDISNLSGENASGSMVVLTHGEVDKSQYRKFKIKISGKPNDVGMHQEMMLRRIKHLEWPLPDLMIIDGGRGQVRAIKEILDTKSLTIPVFGLAKRLEWLYTPQEKIIKLPKSSPSIRLLQKIRDEAHRFALAYHRKLRSRAVGI